MRQRFLTLVAVLSFVSIGSASAATTFDLFVRTSQFDGIDFDFSALPNTTLDGTIVLRETVTEGSESLLAASNLNAAGLRVSAEGSDGRFTDLVTDTSGGVAPNNTADTLTYAAFGAGFGQPGKPAEEVGNGIREIVLGGFTINGPSAGQTTFALNDLNPGRTGDFTTFLGPLDEGEFNFRSFTLTAIPEPGAVGTLMAVGMFVSLRRKRRARR